MPYMFYIVMYINSAHKVKQLAYGNKENALKAVNDLKANKLSLAEIWLTTYESFRKVKNEVFKIKED